MPPGLEHVDVELTNRSLATSTTSHRCVRSELDLTWVKNKNKIRQKTKKRFAVLLNY